jgi:hypothetical protein
LLVCLAPPPHPHSTHTKHQTFAPYPLLNTLPLTHPPSILRCIKALKIKRLSDVCKALKIKDFSSTEKPLKRLLKNFKPLTFKSLTDFFSVLQ